LPGLVGQLQHFQRGGEALQLPAALPRRRFDDGGVDQESEPVDPVPVCRVAAVEELLKADFGLAQKNDIDGVNPEVILRLLYVGTPRYDEQVGEQLFELTCQGEEFSCVPGVETEAHNRNQAGLQRLFGSG